MFISQLRHEDLNVETINKVLFDPIQDDGLSGDLIFVFGSITASKYRVPKAVELYHAGRSTKILMSGGQSARSEAVTMRDAAIQAGVDPKDIIVENQSTNTRDNILMSSDVLDQYVGLESIRRILLVSNFYHLRRCLLTAKTFMPSWIEYSLCGVLDTNTRPDNWFTNEKGKTRVMKEMNRLITYTQSKAIVDGLV